MGNFMSADVMPTREVGAKRQKIFVIVIMFLVISARQVQNHKAGLQIGHEGSDREPY